MSMSGRHLIAIKSETDHGVDAFVGSLPTEWLGIIGQPEIQETTQEIGPEEMTADGLGGQILRVPEKTALSFTTYLVGKADAAGDPPPGLDVLFKASNCAETISAASSAAYQVAFGRSMTDVPSMTVYEATRDDVSGDYYVRAITGVRGTWKVMFTDGKDVRLSFEGVGQYAEKSTVLETISAPTEYSGGKNRLKCQSIAYTYAGDAFGITEIELGTGMTIDEDHDLSATASVDQVGLYLAEASKPGGSTTFKSGEWTRLWPLVKPAPGPQDSGEVKITVTDGTDTVELVGIDTVIGAYSKTLAGGNYEHTTPLTCLGGLTVTFT